MYNIQYTFAFAAGRMQSTHVGGLYIPAFGKSLNNVFRGGCIIRFSFFSVSPPPSSCLLPLLRVGVRRGCDGHETGPEDATGMRRGCDGDATVMRWGCDGDATGPGMRRGRDGNV